MIAAPMTRLLQKNVKFKWGEECQRSFHKLKPFLTEALVLTQPTYGKEYVIFSDASLNGLGCALMQEGKVVVCASRQLKLPMNQKLIEFLVQFSYFYYNVIACFYAEICTINQIYILHKFIAEMKIPTRIRSESSSIANMRS